ncbi:unnamed protein product [Paramecium pentaurelia]|uniref:Uncharacterized protein n=1 Tax=Paramecium pentaurelia TaxID=43138 RepID=A0A8S1YHN2_9CILI|nr:unnamed protein product [Paramecium pentaurelia]
MDNSIEQDFQNMQLSLKDVKTIENVQQRKFMVSLAKKDELNEQHKFEIQEFILLFGKGVVCSIKNAYIWNIFKLMNGDQKYGINLKIFYSVQHRNL